VIIGRTGGEDGLLLSLSVFILLLARRAARALSNQRSFDRASGPDGGRAKTLAKT
jgi:hypothetical protein